MPDPLPHPRIVLQFLSIHAQIGPLLQAPIRNGQSISPKTKVVPPEGWKPTRKDYSALLEKLDVSHPIEQNVQGNGGYF